MKLTKMDPPEEVFLQSGEAVRPLACWRDAHNGRFYVCREDIYLVLRVGELKEDGLEGEQHPQLMARSTHWPEQIIKEMRNYV
jgi:hypothetical protein